MDKTSSAGFFGLSGNSLVAAVAIAAGAFVLHEVPLQSSRPAANEPRLEQRFAPQDVDARLWQDPFGAVARTREEAAKRLKPHELEGEEARRGDQVLRRAISYKLAPDTARGAKEIFVLAVMLPGGPYAEYVESRRRMRYAVLSALNASNFTPFSTEHLGYFIPCDDEGVPRHLPQTVPFEWFEPAPAGVRPCDGCEVLVLWVDNDAFYLNPFGRLKRLLNPLRDANHDARMHWRVIGPVGSDGLRAMVDEASAPDFNERDPLNDMFHGMDIGFVSPLATVPDDTLLGPLGDRGQGRSLAAFMAERNIRLVRTSGDDARLARGLMQELALRGLGAPPAAPVGSGFKEAVAASVQRPPDAGPLRHVALVSEWDTLYGRSLQQQFSGKSGPANTCENCFNYVRGLDGLLPDRAGAAGTQAGTAQATAAKDDRRKDGSFIERAEGQSQFDYLRRLAAHLHQRDRALRAEGDGEGLRAIGVLGNDVHDKLLVLQALQPEFPGAVFFTTDLDARLLHPQEQAWTRNLVVASNFGLQLNEGLQAGTPPFRDTYQTAAFLATRMAISSMLQADMPALQRQVDRWLVQPRLFEVGRTSAFDFSPAAGRPSAACAAGDLQACTDIHPPASPPVPPVRKLVVALSTSAVLALLWVPLLGTASGRRRTAIVSGLVLLHVAVPWGVAAGWPSWSRWLTADGEPLNVTEGLSVWPTLSIYLVAGVVCAHLLYRAWRALEHNLDQVVGAFGLDATRKALQAELDQAANERPTEAFLSEFRSRHVARAVTSDPAMAPEAMDFWKVYLAQGGSMARMARCVAWTVAVVVVSLLLVQVFDDLPGGTIRGDLARGVHRVLTLVVFASTTFLVVYVADATFLCVRFVRQLRNQERNWPEGTLASVRKQIGTFPPALLDHWIDLQFAARRTRCVTTLIYFPFVVLSLLLVARSTTFDDWPVSWVLVAISLMTVAVMLACAMTLRRAAEDSRRVALADIDAAIATAAEPGSTDAGRAAQLQWLRRAVEQLREGAFAPFSQQPVLKAVLLPFATFGGTTLLDYLALANI